MENNAGFKAGEVEKQIEVVDQETPSPSQRAKFVLDLLKQHAPNLTNWDLICFSVEYLGSQSIVYPWLNREKEVVKISRLVYTAHYARQVEPDTGVPNQ